MAPKKKVAKKKVAKKAAHKPRKFAKSKTAMTKDIPQLCMDLCENMLSDLEQGKRPVLEAIKCALDNANYDPKKGFLTPGDKMVRTELNVSSVQKMARAVFLLEIMLRNVKQGTVNTKRELYYISKGFCKHDPVFKPLDFSDQPESDSIIDFLSDLLQVYREELHCFANDRGGQTFSQNLIVTELLEDGTKANIDLSSLGTSPFQPKNRPQSFTLKPKKGKVDFCLIVESEGTANTFVSNGFTKRHNCILMGAQGVPSNGVRAWAKCIQEQLGCPMYFFGDLDAYTLQNIYRTLKAGSAASLIRNSDFSAPDVRFLGILPHEIEKYGLTDYTVDAKNASDARSLKKAQDVLKNDPFFQDKKNKGVANILKWLIKNKKRCEQQAYFMVDPDDPLKPEKIIIDKIKKGDYV